MATYPAMMKIYENFDVGFFDLIVADESHRSIYNRYKPLFDYFDGLQVGLTATPVKFQLLRNTYKLFQCENDLPTFNYDFNEAIGDNPPTLVPFKVITHTTKFLREGIKYEKLNDEQRAEAEDQGLDSDSVDYSKENVDKQVFNKDTDRKVIRNFMEHGIKKADRQTLGKTMVFARSHAHAIILQEIFEEMYPQYGGNFCAVIDNYIERAEQLIDDFKDPKNELTIAISVDMLDTGIDVPEVVNLVFAKPVKSYVKFWQMIGRGTRLCPHLFGPGDHKAYFQIFDHWGNFEYFDERVTEEEPAVQKSLMQYLFEARIDLAETALAKGDRVGFDKAIELIQKDVSALPEKSIAVKEKWRQKRSLEDKNTLTKFEASTVASLKQDMAPLMTWMDIKGQNPAHRFDLLMTRLQKNVIQESNKVEDLKAELQSQVQELPINLNQVRSKQDVIDKVKSKDFWEDVQMDDLENVRENIRSIVHHAVKKTYAKPEPIIMDISDVAEESVEYRPKMDNLELVAYKAEVKRVLDTLFEQDIALQKIKHGKAVTKHELDDLASKVMLRDPKLKINDLLTHYPNEENRLDLAIRTVIGLDAEAVNEEFKTFTEKYPELSAHQLRFLSLLKNHIAQYGLIELDLLYEEPFTNIDEDGVDGVFPKSEQVDDLLQLLANINKLAA
jgi:type I restriction enzyme R subunit